MVPAIIRDMIAALRATVLPTFENVIRILQVFGLILILFANALLQLPKHVSPFPYLTIISRTLLSKVSAFIWTIYIPAPVVEPFHITV